MNKTELCFLLRSKYSVCSPEDKITIDTEVFYPIYEPIIGTESYLKSCKLINKIESDYLVSMSGVGKFRDKASNFFIKK